MGLYSSSLFLFGRCINGLRMAKYTVINGSNLPPLSLTHTHTQRSREREREKDLGYMPLLLILVCVCLVRIYKQASQTHRLGPAAPENLCVCVWSVGWSSVARTARQVDLRSHLLPLPCRKTNNNKKKIPPPQKKKFRVSSLYPPFISSPPTLSPIQRSVYK
jgi:hypothetical protein